MLLNFFKKIKAELHLKQHADKLTFLLQSEKIDTDMALEKKNVNFLRCVFICLSDRTPPCIDHFCNTSFQEKIGSSK